MPATALRISQLLTVSAASVDPELAAFKFRRVVPVAIYVDAGNESTRLGREIARDAKAILKELGYGQTVEWGTFEGSFTQLNIFKGGVPEDEPTFLKKMGQARERVGHKVADKLKKFPWKRAGKVAVSGVKVVVAVGGLAALITAGPATAVALGVFAVPAKAYFAFEVADKGIKMVEGIKGMFVESPPAIQAQQQATVVHSPTPSLPVQSPNAPATSAPADETAQQASAKKIQDALEKQKGKAGHLKPEPKKP
jgi:hypothetical protein